MLCVIDWNALGAWATCLATVAIAVQAHRYTAQQHRRNADRDARAARAFATMAVIELSVIRGHAQLVREAAIKAHAEPTVRSLKAFASQVDASISLRISDALVTAPAMAELPEAAVAEVARVFSVVTKVGSYIVAVGQMLDARAEQVHNLEEAKGVLEVVAKQAKQMDAAIERALTHLAPIAKLNTPS